MKRDHRQVIRQLRDNLNFNENPLSLKETARQLDVSVGYLEYRFPAQCKDIVRRYMLYTQQEQLRKRYLAQSKALEYFISKAKSGQPKSRKKAYRILKEQTGLPKFVLKRAINIAYRALYM
ncbi:hypothetical protein [Teredinibacter turnerae]|uniref:hypothetical protein n=1 Tax=Teredinibacter turnerae TaxID=2426 RepID=UPI0003743239|nr:hypothetical protein [Teredinibacter turnerae]